MATIRRTQLHLPSPTTLLQNLADFILDRSPAGERYRSRLFIAAMLLYWLLVALLEELPPESLLRVADFVAGVPESAQQLAFWIGKLIATFISLQVLRHLPFPALGFLFALRIGSTYLQDLFELKNQNVAFTYLRGAIFGGGRGKIVIKDGKVVESDRESPVYLIGGPGKVIVHLGNAAVFERVGGHIQVLAQGTHRLHGFERFREVVDLRDQHSEVKELAFTTRDGLQVKAHDLQVRFRIHSNQRREESNPYPHKDIAVRRAVYGKVVSEKGARHWTGSVRGFVSGQVRNYLSRFLLDELLPPHNHENPRLKLTHLFYTPDTRERVENMGAEIAWVGVGTVDLGDDITKQRIDHWQDKRSQQRKGDPLRIEAERIAARDSVLLDFVSRVTNGYWVNKKNGTLTAHRVVDNYVELLTNLCENPPADSSGCNEEVEQVIEQLLELGTPPSHLIGSEDSPAQSPPPTAELFEEPEAEEEVEEDVG